MEIDSPENKQDKSNTLRTNEVPAPGNNIGELKMEVNATASEVIGTGGFRASDDISSTLPVGTNFGDHIRESQAYEDIPEVDKVKTFGEVTSDEVMRAGGFGARDGISNFLPVASDFTDFEANLRGAREYEDGNEEIRHPGLGWISESK